MNLIDALLRDHDHLRAAMSALESEPEEGGGARRLAGELAAHARLEDELLFRELAADLPPDGSVLQAMRSEHEEIDGLCAAIARGAGHAEVRRLVQLARDHFFKEEKVLFEFARRLVDGDRLSALGAAFVESRHAALAAAPEIAAETRVSDLARDRPETLRVFQRHGVDFCCGGRVPIAEACERHGIPLAALLDDLSAAVASTPAGREPSWAGRPAVEVVGHVLSRYHAGLREELGRLAAMATRAAERHGERRPELIEIRDLTLRLGECMVPHLDREERTIFPALLSGDARAIAAELGAAEHEHAEVGDLLRRLRAATNGFHAPEEACNTWRGLFHGLAELERDTHVHVHLENNVLFPRALAGLGAS